MKEDMSVAQMLAVLPPWFWLSMAGLFGLLWGSFCNVVIYRVPRGESIVHPASHCGSCNAPIAWFDNVPIVSWLVLAGRCRRCQAKISPRYIIVEALCAVLSAAVMWQTGPTLPFIYDFVFVLVLVVLSAIDLDTWLIPDVISLPTLFFGLATAWFLPGHPWLLHLLGCTIGGAILFLMAFGIEKLMKKEGIGYGDVKLLALIGAFLGPFALPLVLLLSSTQGALVGIIWMRIRAGEPHKAAPDGFQPAPSAVPFGPFLSLAAIEVLFFQTQISQLIGWPF